MITRRRERRVIAHEVRHNHPDTFHLVIQHDWRPTLGAGAKLQWSIRIFGVERLTLQPGLIVDHHIPMFEKSHMGCRLTGHGLADRTMARVIVDWIMIRMCVNVLASTGELSRHPDSPTKVFTQHPPDALPVEGQICANWHPLQDWWFRRGAVRPRPSERVADDTPARQ